MLLTATTITLEASSDTLDVANSADELITATNDRTFAGAGNWEAESDGSVVVNGGKLEVTAVSALSGAKLDKEFFNTKKGFQNTKQYTIVLTLAAISAGTVSVYAGDQLVSSGLTAATHTLTLTTRKPLWQLSVVASNAAATFTIDNVSIKPVAATWNDVTATLTGGSKSSFTAADSPVGMTVAVPEPMSRIRVKRVTTNATNACELRLTRVRL
jgi:hypothetical protein